MRNLREFIPFVNDQANFHEKMAKKFSTDTRRKPLHEKTAAMFRELAQELDIAQTHAEEIAGKLISEIENLPSLHSSQIATPSAQSLSSAEGLTPKDIEGLPKELLAELNISESEQHDLTIINLINEAGGTLSLEKILIGLYRKTNAIYKRTKLTSKLYRMAQKKQIFSVPKKKGVYSTSPQLNDGEDLI